jgi:hypothetical protein
MAQRIELNLALAYCLNFLPDAEILSLFRDTKRVLRCLSWRKGRKRKKRERKEQQYLAKCHCLTCNPIVAFFLAAVREVRYRMAGNANLNV